jgi:hypothetical protein
MMRPVIPAVEALAADERGALLGLLAGGDPSAGARLAGPAGARCRAALEACGRPPAEALAAEEAALAAEIASPLPQGLERVHPGWLRRALERESSALVRAAARGLPAPIVRVADELLRARGESGRGGAAIPEGAGLDALRRQLFGTLAPVPSSEGAGLPLARGLCALPSDELLERIERRGAETLGTALAGAPGDAVVRAAAGVGEPLARVLIGAVRAGAGPAARAAARQVVASVPPDEAVGGAARAVGLRVVARELAAEGAAAAAAVAQRLAPGVGDALLAFAAAGG